VDDPVTQQDAPDRGAPATRAAPTAPEAPQPAVASQPGAAGPVEPGAVREAEAPPAADSGAAAALEPGMTAAPLPERPGFPMAAACQRLGIAPYVLRGLLDEYPEALPLAGERLLTPEAVERLEAILRWRREGLSPDEIRQRLAQGVSTPPDDPMTALLDRLSHLQTELSRSEQRRVEDRDRMMMALVRTQQEIQHLRYELAGDRSRKGRRRGFWRRLFGS